MKRIKKSSKYKVVIIGCGDIGLGFDILKNGNGAFSHFKAFMRNSDFDVVAVSDSRKSKIEKIKSFKSIQFFQDYKLMLKTVKADVVVVATPTDTHYEILLAIKLFKPKLVFCEKPVTTDLNQLRTIIKEYKNANIALQVNFTRRFLQSFNGIGLRIRNGELGAVTDVHVSYTRGLLHNASHHLNLILSWFGYPNRIVAHSSREGISKKDKSVSFSLQYSKGLIVRFVGLLPSKISVNEFDFLGSKGRFRISNNENFETFHVKPYAKYPGYYIYQLKRFEKFDYSKALPFAVKNISDYLKGKGGLISPAQESLLLLKLIETIKSKIFR